MLYRYEVDPSTGEIVYDEIDDVQDKGLYLRYKHDFGTDQVTSHTLSKNKLDKYINNVFFTQNPNINYAFNYIKSYYRSVIKELGAEMDKNIKIVSLLDKVNLMQEVL